MPDFTLTEEHLTLLRNSYVEQGLSGYETGAAWLNPKRPYGNSAVEEDIVELLGWPYPEGWDKDEDELPSRMRKAAMKIHQQTPTALQIVLCTGSFRPGVYRRTDTYGARSWKLLTD
jgi:hypothetical protein